MTRVKNAVGKGTRAWLQLVRDTITVGVGRATLENKKVIPESWVVGRLPVYLGIGKATICLTDLTAEELDLLRDLFIHAYEAARPICEELDEAAFEVLNSSADLAQVPNRSLRGQPPHLIREIQTSFSITDLDPDEQIVVTEYFKKIGVEVPT